MRQSQSREQLRGTGKQREGEGSREKIQPSRESLYNILVSDSQHQKLVSTTSQ